MTAHIPAPQVVPGRDFASDMHFWLTQKKRAYGVYLSEWDIELVRQMAIEAGVSQGRIFREAIKQLFINFDPSLFTKE